MSRLIPTFILAFSIFLIALPSSILACPFCPSAGQTLVNEVNSAHFVVLGKMLKVNRDPEGGFGKGTTEMSIEVVIKDHPILKDKKTIILPRMVPPDPKNEIRFLVFCEVYDGKIDPYKGEQIIGKSEIPEYLKGAIQIKDKPATEKLAYYFKHLDSPDWLVAADAFQEFANSDYKDVREAAKKFSPEKLVNWLKSPTTPPSRIGLYGMLLGHCGQQKEHAAIVKSLLNDQKIKELTGLDGLLAGYVLLDQKEGLNHLSQLVANPKEEHYIRYAGLRTYEFLKEYHPEILSTDEIVKRIEPMLDFPEDADLVIEKLRKWERWDFTPKIIALFTKDSHKIPLVQRSIIKYALCVQGYENIIADFIERVESDEENSDRLSDIKLFLEQERKPENSMMK